MCFDADVFNPLTLTEEAEREISVKDICGSLKESFVDDKIIEMSENDRSCRISNHRRGQGMCRGRSRAIKCHIEKIKKSKEECKF